MRYDEYMRWAERLAAHKPGSDKWNEVWGRLWVSPYFPGCAIIYQGINVEARKLYKERRRPLKGRDGSSVWIDEFADPWGPNGRYGAALVSRDLEGGYVKPAVFEVCNNIFRPMRWYGCSPAKSAMPDVDMVRSLHRTLFNTEGEKQMEKIDWYKPLRALKAPGHEIVDAKVYTYKSGRQRVIWVDERVYPVDDQGRATANVDYGPNWVQKGQQIVENVPEEKFFVGLARDPNGTYWLMDGGMVSGMGTMNYWKRLRTGLPHWIVDTRKSAEPPQAIAHDPEDWTTIYTTADGRVDNTGLMTKSEAEEECSLLGEQVVRVRTTPAPVDTSRYIVLWREGPSRPWRIDKFGDGRQEFTWAEIGFRVGRPDAYCIVKVRD